MKDVPFATHMTEMDEAIGLKREPGWLGGFTRNRADGAWPNGSRVKKLRGDEGSEDFTPNGTMGTVLGSITAPGLPIIYFIEWDDKPKIAVGCAAPKLELVSEQVSTQGYAVVDNGTIDINTVCDTRRGAIVNYLHVRCGVFVMNDWSDERIEEAWQRAMLTNLAVVKVDVTVTDLTPAE